MTDNKRADSFSNYIICFFIYSVVLWIYNMVATWVMTPAGSYSPTWVLYGPYAPYAALEIMGIMALFKLFQRLGKPKDINPTPIFLVVMSVILFSALEYLGSLCYELIFKTVPWDYSGRIMNINGRVCCEHIVALTVVELICVYVAQPFFNRVLNKIPVWVRYIFALLFATVITTDIVCTFMK